jgi:PAS domain S-box-containing protein
MQELMDTREDVFRLLVDGVRDYAIFLVDESGHVVSWNQGAQLIFGHAADEIRERHYSVFYLPEDVSRGWPERCLQLARAVGRVEDEGWRLRVDGSRFWADVVVTALPGADETGAGFSVIVRDLTERRRHDESLQHIEERFRLMVECVSDYAIVMLDETGLVTSWNTGATRISGYSAEDMIGEHFSRFYPLDAIERGWPQHELEIAGRDGRFEDRGWRLRKDGTRFWANVIITAMHDSEGKLRGYAKVTRDLTETKRAEALEEAGRQTTEFLAMLAHELRNPLAPIRNAVSMMRISDVQDPSLLRARDMIDRQVDHLTRLVDDLLDIGRIRSGKITLRREPLDVGTMLARAVEASQPLITARRHALQVLSAPAPLMVLGDTLRLAQVVTNLLNNAAKYTPEGGYIWLSLERQSGHALIRVRDNGMGIRADVLPRIFELFMQADRGLARSEGGLGIGLTLVDRLVDLHGGSVEAYSAGPGLGSEFIVRLPLISATLSSATTPEGEPQTPPPPRRRVLVVDDHYYSALSMSMLIEALGHDARSASNGPDAIGSALEYQPDLVLLDIGLPGMSGYEVARRLRSLDALKGMRIAAMTGYGQEEDRRRSLDAGFDQHLVKPVELSDLDRLLKSL